MFTSEPHINVIFHTMRQLRWKNIQWCEWTKLESTYTSKWKGMTKNNCEIVGVDLVKQRHWQYTSLCFIVYAHIWDKEKILSRLSMKLE